jgi:tRNA nucleotidyltransferase (CCA-adding enzyme)
MKIYLVGGAVRDRLLGIPYTERDWVVVGATPEEMLSKGFRRADRDFPVFLHPESGEEYALARTEVKVAPGYKGFQLAYGVEITLEQDLLRRDLTINALAMDESGQVIDVCHGQRDLNDGILRHITPAFTEDPLRLLRVARFAAKLGQWGFRVAHATHGLMKKMAVAAELQTLSSERVWLELSRAMAEPQPWRFFEVLHRCAALQWLLPEVAEEMRQDAGGHGEAAGSATLVTALKRIAPVSDEPGLRCAVALFHSALQQTDLQAWIRNRRIAKQTGQTLVDLLRFRQIMAVDKGIASLFDFAAALKSGQQPERFQNLMMASQALWPARMTTLVPRLEQAREVLLIPVPEEISRSGLSGKALGEAIRFWRLSCLQRILQEQDD